jgi:predicted PurR-regulated permease PerM
MDLDPLATASERADEGEKSAPPFLPPPPPSSRARAATYALIVLAVVAVLAVVYVARLVLIVLLLSVLLAYMLAPAVELLERLHITRALASLLAVLLFCGLVFQLGSASYNQAVAFARELPKYSSRIRNVIGSLHRQAREFQKSTETVLPEESPEPQPLRVQQQSSWVDWIISSLGPVTEVVFITAFIPFLTYFMLSWQDHVRSATVMLFDLQHRNTAYVTLGLISRMIRSFIVGNVLLGLLIGALSSIVFAILHLPYFYFVGFISGFLSLVPYLGVVFAAFPPILAGLGQIHSTQVIVILLTVIGLHLFALNVLYPKILGSRLQLNPLAVTIALMFWGWLWGGVGLVLAVPITAALKIVFDHVEPMRGYGAWLGE